MTTGYSQLNPAFSEWLMGLLPGWTDCDAAVTPWFPSWLHTHSTFLRRLLEGNDVSVHHSMLNEIKIAAIKIGSRHRKDMGDLPTLADSIRQEGLLQPIGVTDKLELVFGERRLLAVRDILKKQSILARIVNVSSTLAGGAGDSGGDEARARTSPARGAQRCPGARFGKTLFLNHERDTEKGRERAIGVLLSKNRKETFEAKTETKRLRVRLDGGIRRWVKGESPHTRYFFKVVEEENLPLDA